MPPFSSTAAGIWEGACSGRCRRSGVPLGHGIAPCSSGTVLLHFGLPLLLFATVPSLLLLLSGCASARLPRVSPEPINAVPLDEED
jgi:hypothetical protein